ncbi:hypothetical protein CASFOL_042921 [Castilleja foliolosa]|uniref:ATP synthase F0 subunit 8 n=1 Tax=Castilleja foliolosa TaxID=1961234 RepID=A0ABD3B785_9LAMI
MSELRSGCFTRSWLLVFGLGLLMSVAFQWRLSWSAELRLRSLLRRIGIW